MRQMLTKLGARGTITLILAFIIVGILGVAKLVGASSTGVPGVKPHLGPSAEQNVSTVSPTAGNDGVVASATDAVVDSPAARKAAVAFTKLWLRRTLTPEKWHDGLVPRMTENLAAKLNGVDPGGVPALRTTGPAKVTQHRDAFAEVDVPVDSGTLTLRLLEQEGRWLVDSVDWTRQ